MAAMHMYIWIAPYLFRRTGKEEKQAGAELCQAQVKLEFMF